MLKNFTHKLFFVVSVSLSVTYAQDADPIEAARQAKLAAEKAAADAEAATGAAIEAAASRAAAAAREKVIAGRKAEEARKIAEKEAAENAEIDAAAEAAALEARRKLAAELGLELEDVPDSSVSAEVELATLSEESSENQASNSKGFDVGFAPSIGIVKGSAIESLPIGGSIVATTPFGFNAGPLSLKVSIGAGGYSVKSLDPIYLGVGANSTLGNLVFSETHLGLVGKGAGIRQFAGVTLDKLMSGKLELPFNVLIGGEGFISTDIDGNGIQTYWGGLGVRIDI